MFAPLVGQFMSRHQCHDIDFAGIGADRAVILDEA
jgi:hypothetical protein